MHVSLRCYLQRMAVALPDRTVCTHGKEGARVTPLSSGIALVGERKGGGLDGLSFGYYMYTFKG